MLYTCSLTVTYLVNSTNRYQLLDTCTIEWMHFFLNIFFFNKKILLDVQLYYDVYKMLSTTMYQWTKLVRIWWESIFVLNTLLAQICAPCVNWPTIEIQLNSGVCTRPLTKWSVSNKDTHYMKNVYSLERKHSLNKF